MEVQRSEKKGAGPAIRKEPGITETLTEVTASTEPCKWSKAVLLASASKVRWKEMEEQKEFLMSSAYMSRLQHDVQLSNLYLNHLWLFNESERWCRQISLLYLHKLHSVFFNLLNYLNIRFIFNWKHFSCFILNNIFNVKVLMHYYNNTSFKQPIVK